MTEKVDLLKLHFKRKENLIVQFGVTNKKIQSDTDEFIAYLIGLNKNTVSKDDLLTFCETYTNSFYHSLIDWGDNTDPQFANNTEYRYAQIDVIIANKSIVFNTNNKMVQIIPI